MNIRKKMMMLFMIIIVIFIGMMNIDAKTFTEIPESDRKCSRYFDIVDVTYGESVGVAGGLSEFYDSEDFIGTHWINGKHVSSGADNYWTSTGSNITAWYYYDAFTKFTTDAKVIITVYNKDNSNICTETITGFNTDETHFKLRLQHNIRSQWVNIKGTFSDYDGKKTNNAKIATEIKVDNVAAEIVPKDASQKTQQSQGVTNTYLQVNALITDPNAWGKWHSIHMTKCQYYIDGGTEANNCSGSEYLDKQNECEDGSTDCKFATLQVLIPKPAQFQDHAYKYDITIEAIKQSGKKTTKTISFDFNGKGNEVINTTTQADPNKCPNGSSKDKNGNCANDKDSYGNSIVTKADYVKKVDTDKTYDIESGNIGCTQDIKDLINDYWKYIMILAPTGLILLIVVDFVKALTSSDVDQLKKSANTALKRTISTVVLLMLPLLLGMVLEWFGIDLCL